MTILALTLVAGVLGRVAAGPMTTTEIVVSAGVATMGLVCSRLAYLERRRKMRARRRRELVRKARRAYL